MKLLLDEMYPRLIATELRRRGHARSEGRAITTENIRDYRPLAHSVHAAGETHSGLILTTAKRRPRHDPGALITALDDLVRANPNEIDNEEHRL